MTKTEAINIMLQMIKDEEEFLSDDTVEAHKMAIQALSQEPCEDWYDVPSDEMTLEQARQAVKDLRKKLTEYLEQEPCDDAISRDAALEKMADYVASGYADSAEDFLGYSRIICQLPSVTRKSGKWIVYNYPAHECVYCSKCKTEYYECDLYLGGSEFPNFCPNCGAKMVEPQESEEI